MNTRLLLDLRYRGAPLAARALYALLYDRRADLPGALAVLSPEGTAAAVWDCARPEALEHLATLRAHGLVGPGLELLAGVARARAVTVANTDANPVTVTGVADDLRARALASGRGASDLAKATGLGRSSLAHFLAGTKGIGAGARMLLADALDGVAPVTNASVTVTVTGHTPAVTPVTPQETQGITVTAPVTPVTASPSLLALPALLGSLPVSPAPPLTLPPDLPDSPNPPALTAREAGETGQEPEQTPEAAPAKALTLSTQETLSRAERAAAKAAAALAERDAKVKAKEAARAERAAAEERARAEKEAARAARIPVDPIPAAGTVAHRVYLAITTDRVLCPITVGPGAFAELSCADGTYPGVDVLAEVRRAAEWVSGKPHGTYRDGRGFLRSWLRRAAERERMAPKAAPVGARVTGTVADLTARAMAEKAERERLAQAAKEPQAAAGGAR